MSQYKKMVEAAEAQRKESIEKANGALEGIKTSIEKHNPNIWSAVDKQTGGIKSRFQKLKEELGTYFCLYQACFCLWTPAHQTVFLYHLRCWH